MATRTQSGAIVVDLKRCLACRSCELACAKVHAGFVDIVDALLAGAHLVPRVMVIAAAGRAVPVQCRHCEDAPCVTVCPSGALYKDEVTGRVLTAPEKCIGCRACVRVCPYEAVIWDEHGETVVKCDVCEGIIEVGEEPWCVRACPTGALRSATLEEMHTGPEAQEYDVLVRDESRIGAAGPDVTFEINPEECICCGRCARDCPVDCIAGRRGRPPARARPEDEEKGKVGKPFEIDQDECVKCGTCFEVCRVGAVKRT